MNNNFLNRYLLKVHRVKLEVLQFLLDLVEVSTDVSTNGSECRSASLDDDDCASELTMNDHSTTNTTSHSCSQLATTSNQSTDHAGSKSAEGDGDSQQSNVGDTDRCSILDAKGVKDEELPSKEVHVRMTPNDDLKVMASSNCCVTKFNDENKFDFTSHDNLESKLKSPAHSPRSSEASIKQSVVNSQERGCCKCDEGLSSASCRQFEKSEDQEKLVCARTNATVPDYCQTLEQQQTSSTLKNAYNTKSMPHNEDDNSAQEDIVADNGVSEDVVLMSPLVKDVTWDTLVGNGSPDEHLLSEDAEKMIRLQEYECCSNAICAASTPILQVLHNRRNHTVSSISDSNSEGHIISPGGLSDYSVSQLFSSAWNALLLHTGLECVDKFKRSLLRSDSGCDCQLDSRTSKSDDETEERCVQGVQDPPTTDDGDAEENLTQEDDKSDAECCRPLMCFCCLQCFEDAEALRTHFERVHCQQQPPAGLHSLPERESVVSGSGLPSVDSFALGSIMSGHASSAAGIWNRLHDSTSSYFGGISPEILSLLSAVPPELMLPHLYPGSVIPPALLMMMMASPFVDCPSSPLPSSLAALADSHPSLLTSSAATESRATFDDAAVASSVHQASKRARTRITDSQLAVLRARFDINGPPSDDEIATIGSEIGLPSKVVKHWFRNTLFKERQRSKDSPYNFSVPPSSDLPSASSLTFVAEKVEMTAAELSGQSVDEEKDYDRHDNRTDSSLMLMQVNDKDKLCPLSLPQQNPSTTCTAVASEPRYFPHGCYFGVPFHPAPQALPLLPSVTPVSSAAMGGTPIISTTASSPGVASHHQSTSTQSRGGHGKRASRTHFSDEQVRTLQDHFERNAYPRDDELESLSRRLGLSARVIVVWFQNARQKARRTYENHASAAGGSGALSGGAKNDDGVGGPRYDCRSCGAAFQRYYELIKHQRSHIGCGSVVPSTSTKYSARLPDASSATLPHDSSQLRYDKPPNTDATAAATGLNSSSRHRRHQSNQTRVDAWYRPPLEGYVGAVSPRDPEMAGAHALPAQHALPVVFPTHLPLMTSWNSATGCKKEASPSSTSSGFDLTASRRQTDLVDSLVDKKCAIKLLDDQTSREQSARSSTTYLTDSCRSSAVRYDNDCKQLQRDYTTQQSPELLLNSTEETSYSSTPSKRHRLAELMSSHLQQRVISTPILSPSSAMFSDSSAEQQGRQLLGGGEIVATLSSLPRRTYDVQHHAVSFDAPLLGLNTTPCSENESPLDLSCQPKTSSSWSVSDKSSEALGEDEPKQVAPVTGAVDSGSGTTSKSQQVGGSSKRHRTHMSDLQVRVMRAIYAHHRTPSIGECATLGAKIGLARRVVQVWFQNARAKDKKRCLTEGGGLDDGSSLGDSEGGMATADGRCRWCGVTYAVERCSVREHVFSPEHVAAVDRIVRADAERRGVAGGGRAGKRDHRRRLLHRTMTSNSPASVLQISSSMLSTTPPTSSVARKIFLRNFTAVICRLRS